MRVSAKVDYALRALTELAASPPGYVKAERLATAQEIPLKFLENILLELRRARSSRASAAPRAATSWRSPRQRSASRT